MTLATPTARVSLRVPARVVGYMEGTGWAQGSEEADVARDPVRQRLRAAMGHRNADGSITIGNPSDAMLARLVFEADILRDSAGAGDNTMDDLADRNAANALMRRVAAIRPEIRPYNCVELMASEQTP